MRFQRLAIFAFALIAPVTLLFAAENIANLRGVAPITEEGPAPWMPQQRNQDLREVRNYPEQPPVIPHEIEGYRIDLNSNKCLSCHARAQTGQSQAPMVSITHYMDRDGQFRAAVTPRRYFCTQCHVPQLETDELIENDFVDIDALIQRRERGRQ